VAAPALPALQALVQFAPGVSSAEQDAILTRGGAKELEKVRNDNGKDTGDLVLVKVSWRQAQGLPAARRRVLVLPPVVHPAGRCCILLALP
jgi:hypothetical protein